MARNKRRRKDDLRKKPQDSPAYWEELLQREGLSMSAGRNARLIYVGESAILERIEGEIRTDTGKVEPK